MKIKRLAESLVRKYKTRNPFDLAKALGFIVVRVPLVGIRGFYQQIKRCTIIYISDNLPEFEARFVCAHEIGHAILHRGSNRMFMDAHTYFKVNTYEIAADRFAVSFLYSDDDIMLFREEPVQLLADCLGISIELANYRMKMIEME